MLILIKKLGTRLDKNGYTRHSYGLFLCPICLKEVERIMSNGKKQKSCGCIHGELISNYLKGKKHTEERRKKNSESNKGRVAWNKELFGINLGKKRTEEVKQFLSKIKKGKLNPNWQGGISNNPYGDGFTNLLKCKMKIRDGNKCQNPECIMNNPKRLDIHHIDYDKQNNDPKNLITLCASCHTKTKNKNKLDYWRKFYQNIMIKRNLIDLLV